MLSLFKRRTGKVDGKEKSPTLRRDSYSLLKNRTLYDGSSRTIQTSLEQVLSDLKAISLFQSGDSYVLPGAQTRVSPSENESHIYLDIRTIRPVDISDHPAHGHEESLEYIIKKYDFEPEDEE